ncbi:MAG TPA: nitrogenase component 1 [Rubrobacter sp.]|nr:nitrogenase component 1 [Rubrobacter sp.]
MRLLRGVYEGPGSHGILRVAASVRGVHAVLRALPSEGYFPALYGSRERTGETAPVTLSPLGDKTQESLAPGNLARDLSGVVRRHPRTEAVVLARSDAALLSGEAVPATSLPESPGTGRTPELVTCSWETPGIKETEAAELALEDLIRAHVRGRPARSRYPTVNLFGPPVFGPSAAAEYAEAERLMHLIGVEVNARVPFGASVGDLGRLPRAWANVLLYREVGESATLYLQDEFGMGRVTTPMIGAAGTGAALRAVGELCDLDPKSVRRTIWAELAHTAKLPWYSRLEPPEVLHNRRVAIFGDFTYPLGLGYALAREVGLEVTACGTYLTHLERDFLFHANTFTEGAFVEDDPEKVAARIEAADPDLVVGTHLEEAVADSLDVPFLPLCPPVNGQPFVGRPLMGYAGSSVLADALDGVLNRTNTRREVTKDSGLPWTDGALQDLARVPPFLRGRARRLAEDRARENGSGEVTREVFLTSRH